MRVQDLIPAFLSEAFYLRLTKEERTTVRRIEGQYECMDDDSEIWDTEEASYDLDALFDILDAHSLPYFYFGANDGDGADYGWWLSDMDGAYDGLRLSDLSEMPKGYSGEAVVVNDHGNMTLYSVSRGRPREIWAVV